jgi:hypothetical protein
MAGAAPGPTPHHNAVEQLAAALANAMVLIYGQQALREGRVDFLGLVSPVARLALSRALAEQVPGCTGLWLDQPAPAAEEALEHFLATVLRAEGGPSSTSPGS